VHRLYSTSASSGSDVGFKLNEEESNDEKSGDEEEIIHERRTNPHNINNRCSIFSDDDPPMSDLTSPTTTTSSTVCSQSSANEHPPVLEYHQLCDGEVGGTALSLVVPCGTVKLHCVADPWVTIEHNWRHRNSHVFYQGSAVVDANLFSFQQYEALWVPREQRGYVAGGVAYCKSRERYFILMSLWRTKCIDRAMLFVLYDLAKRCCTLENRLTASNVYMVDYSYTNQEWTDACASYKDFAQKYVATPGRETDFKKHLINPPPSHESRYREQAELPSPTVTPTSKRKSTRTAIAAPPTTRTRVPTLCK
jgi:hypothetical protein